VAARRPTPLKLSNDPELAALAALNLLLEISVSALLAEHRISAQTRRTG
jgi:hypothetical protein